MNVLLGLRSTVRIIIVVIMGLCGKVALKFVELIKLEIKMIYEC